MRELEQKERECPIHGTYTSKHMTMDGLPSYLCLDSWTICPECEKIQLQKDKLEEAEQQTNYQNQKYKNCGIEPEFYSSTFDNYKATTESQKKALSAVQKITENHKGKVLLLGSNGVGKTHLACAAVKKLGGHIYTMYEITTLIRQSYSANATESELEIVDRMASIPLLVIDEVGRTKGSESERNWLSYIIDKRHVRGLPLIIISNRKLAKNLPKERQGEAIEYYFDNDIISRFRQDTSIIEIEGKDARCSE